MKRNYGFIPTLITDKTVKYQAPKTMNIPVKFSYRPFLSPITDQGCNPYCIPHSIATWLNWKMNTKKGLTIDNHIRYEDIYKGKKSMFGEGMTYQEAFDTLKKKGVKTDSGIVKIKDAGFISSHMLLKAALLANGPCFGALPVYDSESQTFWKKTKMKPEGWHSITIVGWDEKGYIIRNSWGTGYADHGYVLLSYEDTSSFKELWTILS